MITRIKILLSVILIAFTITCLIFNSKDNASVHQAGLQYIRVDEHVFSPGNSSMTYDVIFDSNSEEFDRIYTALHNADLVEVNGKIGILDGEGKTNNIIFYKDGKKAGGWYWLDDDLSLVYVFFEDRDGYYAVTDIESQNLLKETIKSLAKD